MDAVVKSLLERPQPQPSNLPFARPTREEAEAAVRVLLRWTGDDPSREGLRDTPQRVVKAFEEFFSGYQEDAANVLSRVFEEVHGYDDVVLVRDIPFSSHCEHHMVPFFGMAHVAYYPSETGVVGLSKLARLVFGAIDRYLRPRGCAVMLEAQHLCMSMRGVRKHGADTVTTQFTGIFRDDPAEQARFLTMLRGGK